MSTAHRRIGTALAGLLMTSAIAAAPAHAAVRDCHVYADFPNVLISSARTMSCRSAEKVMLAYKGDIKKRFTVRRFSCSQQSGSQFGGQWRCVSGQKAFRFEFKD
jgi:hypothetical protein